MDFAALYQALAQGEEEARKQSPFIPLQSAGEGLQQAVAQQALSPDNNVSFGEALGYSLLGGLAGGIPQYLTNSYAEDQQQRLFDLYRSNPQASALRSAPEGINESVFRAAQRGALAQQAERQLRDEALNRQLTQRGVRFTDGRLEPLEGSENLLTRYGVNELPSEEESAALEEYALAAKEGRTPSAEAIGAISRSSLPIQRIAADLLKEGRRQTGENRRGEELTYEQKQDQLKLERERNALVSEVKKTGRELLMKDPSYTQNADLYAALPRLRSLLNDNEIEAADQLFNSVMTGVVGDRSVRSQAAVEALEQRNLITDLKRWRNYVLAFEESSPRSPERREALNNMINELERASRRQALSLVGPIQDLVIAEGNTQLRPEDIGNITNYFANEIPRLITREPAADDSFDALLRPSNASPIEEATSQSAPITRRARNPQGEEVTLVLVDGEWREM